jgi:hypothetical protein
MGGAATKRLILAISLLCLTIASAGQAKPYKTYIQKGNLRVAFWGHIAPRKLPRVGVGPVEVSISASIATIDNTPPPQLRTIKLEINRNGRLDPLGLPACRFHQIQPASTVKARRACAPALVGHGSFHANVALPEQSPFPSNGEILAFNGRSHGRPVILAHIYGTEPLPTSFTLPFHIRHHRGGTYGLVLTAHLPQVAAEWGFIKGLSLTLGRRFRYRGELRSYVAAGCPAPAGFPGSVFALARMHFGFDDGETLSSVIVRNCYARHR